jgi:methylglutaconyl-CoA hydratase
MPTAFPALRLERHGAIARLSIDRPALHNAFDATLVAELIAALERLDGEPDVRVVILTGMGSTFSAGADLNWMRSMAAAGEAANRDDALALAHLMRALNFFSKPTIARVNGSAYGGGVGLIACCDVSIGCASAKFSLSEVRLGLVPAVISPYVIAAIGARHARRLFVSGEVFDASHAERIGLLHACVAEDALDAAVEKSVHWLLKGGAIAQREAKLLALRMSGTTPESAALIDIENAVLIARLRVSEEGQEGLTAFLDKRPPRWVLPG